MSHSLIYIIQKPGHKKLKRRHWSNVRHFPVKNMKEEVNVRTYYVENSDSSEVELYDNSYPYSQYTLAKVVLTLFSPFPYLRKQVFLMRKVHKNPPVEFIKPRITYDKKPKVQTKNNNKRPAQVSRKRDIHRNSFRMSFVYIFLSRFLCLFTKHQKRCL